MKKISLLLLSFLLILSGCKKNGDLVSARQDYPIPTPVGTAIGGAVNKTIGKTGGTVSSADGIAELVFPAGALENDIPISIQAISNNAPNGRSNAYRFTPDGLKFSKPVTLKFHYQAADLAATLADLMGIAYQNSSGIWLYVNNFSNDSVNKIISAPITHFSDWTLFDLMHITPSSASVKVNGTVNLVINYVNPSDDDSSLIAPLLNKLGSITWQVNSVSGGNSTIGTLTGSDDQHQVYTAPSKVPAQNPVAVTADVQIKFKYHGKSFDKTTLVSNINISGDKYLLEIVEKRDLLQKGLWLTDSASMDVDIAGSGVVITNIKNFIPVHASPANVSETGCTFSYIPENIGDINITAATAEMRIQSATETGIQFFFTHSGTVDPSYRQLCPSSTGPPFDVILGSTPNEGNPATLFFNLTDSVVYDNDDLVPGYSLKAKLTQKKQ